MSSPKFHIDLSPAAQDDLIAIIHYTAANWGEAQARVYHAAMDEAFETICSHPTIGHTTPDLSDAYRLFLVGSHVIVYREQNDRIKVVRVMHQRMSLSKHL